eukprot:TRINITY_DN4868_c0_g1_i2.p1 TRINITY_DN4868_c0_g1~~TRINITY_DN4868_c0_g1_i2.p1  ORF type:complete len:948 (-),score=182.08 TRINITY_DN4868_c0_g1_i2:93-2936(-)
MNRRTAPAPSGGTNPTNNLKENSGLPDKTWKGSHFRESEERYLKMVSILSEHLTFTAMWAQKIDITEADTFAASIINVFSQTGNTIPLINKLIYKDFENNSGSQGSILRGNSVVSKIERAYVKKVGSEYLILLVGELLNNILNDENLDLEIDKRKIKPTDSQTVDQIAEARAEKLRNIAQSFIDRITSTEMVAAMPREIKAIADFIAHCERLFKEKYRLIALEQEAEQKKEFEKKPEAEKALEIDRSRRHTKLSENMPDIKINKLAALIGGFIMLRFISPAMVTPETWLTDTIPTPSARRNLVLITKILQNISNQIGFGIKEEYMCCMNDFIVKNITKVEEWLLACTVDTQSSVNLLTTKEVTQYKRSWSDLGRKNDHLSCIAIQDLNLIDLLELHRLLEHCTPSLIIKLTTDFNPRNNVHKELASTSRQLGRAEPITTAAYRGMPLNSGSASAPAHSGALSLSSNAHLSFSTSYITNTTKPAGDSSWLAQIETDFLTPQAVNDILHLLRDLGPPPILPAAVKNQDSSQSPGSADDEIHDGLDGMLENTSAHERSRFLYSGPPTKDNTPVFYLIVNRVKLSLLTDMNSLIAYVTKVLESANGKYVLVIDMSWAIISVQMKAWLYTHLRDVYKSFGRKYKKNLQNIFVVHPNALTRYMLYFTRTFTSRKLSKKVIDIYYWKELARYIPLNNILLPDSSKDYIAKSYRVQKLNAKGKKQTRLIKFTQNSILNIDPKTKTIKNEKMLCEIEVMSTFTQGSPELQIHFSADSINNALQTKKANGGLLTRIKQSAADEVFRRYLCENAQDRDMIIMDLFQAGFMKRTSYLPQEYTVIKINKSGKKQNRVFKLTCDSLMNLDGGSMKIKKEIPFAGIDSVTLSDAEGGVELRFKGETRVRKVICPGLGSQFVEAVKQGMTRYKHEIEEFGEMEGRLRRNTVLTNCKELSQEEL